MYIKIVAKPIDVDTVDDFRNWIRVMGTYLN